MMTSDEQALIERFARLFAGRADAYGSEEGGCVRQPPTFQEHLWGSNPIGVYPMVPRWENVRGVSSHANPLLRWHVKWGAVDFDVKSEHHKTYDYETPQDAFTAARDLVAALRLLGLPGWIERTRSCGYHVWVFAGEWVPAADMRGALLAACQVADVSTREVNPKSVGSDDPAYLGNYVRAPYPGWAERTDNGPDTHTRVMVTERGVTIPLHNFLDLAEYARANSTNLSHAASLLRGEGVIIGHNVEFVDVPELDKTITDRLSGLTWTVYSEGPDRASVDRSAWLYRLACLCRDDGLEPEEAAAVVSSADEKWTRKFTDRRDGELRLMETVRRAYR